MSSIDITSTSTDTVDVLGLNDISADLTLALTQPFKTEGSNTVKADLDLDTKSELKVDPLKADLDTSTHLKIDPLRTDSNVSLDVKPAVVDLCLTLNVGKVPNLCIKQPYRHHFGFTLYGTEIWGFSLSGEQVTFIQEQRPKPSVALGPVVPEWAEHHERHEHSSHRHGAPEAPTRETGGLRIRLGT